MKYILTTKHIAAIADLPIRERLEKIQQASSKLTPPEKLLLNVAKLFILIPIFVIVLRSPENWVSLLWILVIALAYPLVLKPLRFALIDKYIQSEP